jgi:radical SAM protein with 4Fe4S-binding SPASM domain
MTDNKNFCYAPWTHLYTNPDGRLLPCCLFVDNNQDFPNLNDTPLEEALNHPKMIKLRQEFLEGKDPAGCFRCKAQSKISPNTYRDKMNNFGREANPEIKTDGTLSLKDFDPTFLDIRFGNLCNLKCRTCSPTFSSSIAVEHNKIWGTTNKILFSLNDSTIDTIFSKLDSVKHIYLAGGEPLIEENNYILLNKLIERGLKPSLLYNTNLTNIKFKDKNLTDLWQHFPEVTMTVSLDGYGPVNNYIRFGSDYEQIIQNIFTIKEHNPHVKFSINAVASIMSMRSIPDLFKDLITREICIPRSACFSICHHPDELDPTVLPLESKQEIAKQYDEHIEWLIKNCKDQHKLYLPNIIQNTKGLIEYMMSADNSHRLPQAIEKLGILDKARNTNYKEVIKL